jgi:hypothetical protein
VKRREHQRDGVIRPRVAVNDQFLLVHAPNHTRARGTNTNLVRD